MKQIFIILLLLFPSILLACICIKTKSFNLQEYDENKNILEIEILSEIPDDYEKKVEQHRKDTMNWDKPYPPIPLMPKSSYTDFKIKIHETYKGEKKEVELFRANDIYSSCYWIPKTGQRFIVYTDGIGDDKIVYGFGCQRFINYNTTQYHSEKKILKLLQHKKDGKFKINQNELIENYPKKYIAIEGEFKDGLRIGKWILREPILHGDIIIPKMKKVLILKYKKAEIISKKYIKPKTESIIRLTRKWELRYIHNL